MMSEDRIVEICCEKCGARKLVRCKSSGVAGAIRAGLVHFECPKCRVPGAVNQIRELDALDRELAAKVGKA
jgi:predicted RNA-binding Zn-ribbon protein involved in translation (DUF1610 family)